MVFTIDQFLIKSTTMGIKENRAYIKMQTLLRVMPEAIKETWKSYMEARQFHILQFQDVACGLCRDESLLKMTLFCDAPCQCSPKTMSLQ